MREAEIAAYILQHDARNLQLKRRLAERGIDWRNEYQITCRFLAPNQQQASRLKEVLLHLGFVAAKAEPSPGRARAWRVESQVRQSIDCSASHEFTQQVVRSAAALSCLYEGWEAHIAPEVV
jgi:Regulator of ribonuclease activity B